MTKVYTEDMGEISGFGGGYEDCCRQTLMAGVAWLDAHPEVTLEQIRYHAFDNIYGIVEPVGEYCAVLDQVLCDAADPLGGLTGAQHQAIITQLLFIKRHGWEEYVETRRQAHQTDQPAAPPDAGGETP